MDKFELAQKSNTPPEVLEKLATDEAWGVRYSVAHNPNTPPKALEKLANDKDIVVRRCVAYTSNTPKYIKTYISYQDYNLNHPLV